MGDSNNPRPPPTANGTLAKTPLLHLLVYAFEKKLTGTIELLAPDRRGSVLLFAGGQPTKARTSEPVAYLGRVLHELGLLSEVELTQSLAELAKAKAAGPMLHGKLLLERGIIDADKLKAGLREQIARKLRHVAAMPRDTVYAYYDGFDALRAWGAEGAPVDPLPLLWGMLLEYPPWDRVTPALESVGTSRLRLTREADLGRLALSKDERAAVELLRSHPLRVPEFSHAARLNDRTAQLLCYLLLATKQVDVLSAAQTPAAPQVKASPSVRSMPATRASPTSARASMPPSARTPSTPSVRAMPAASVPPNPPVSVRPAGLSSPPAQTIPPSRGPTPKPGAVTGSLPPSPPPPSLSPELLERWHEIVDRAATIDRADYFTMLGVEREATREDVESAFFALAKRWHPDRLAPELVAVSDACSRVFGRMSEAHATLTNDEERAQYMRRLADGSGSPETQAALAKVIEAVTNFQKAEVCFRRNDFVQAEAFCRRALEDDPTQPDYHALLAWLAALKPENQSPEKTGESIQMLEKAISLSDRCEKAYFWRGMLYKRIGRNDAAIRDFRRAAELNPRNIDAMREVRLYHLRGGRRSSRPPNAKRSTPAPSKPPEPIKPGLLGRLFKKP